MKFWADFWRASLSAQLRGVRNWALLLLLPLLNFGIVRLMPPQEVSAPIQVGVVLPEEGGEDFWRHLEARSGLAVTFQRASEAEARRQVAAGRWDCALVLRENFSARLESGDLEGIFTMIQLSARSAPVRALVQEAAAASLAHCVSPKLAEDYLLERGIVEPWELTELRPRLAEELLEAERVLVTLETADGAELDALTLADQGVSRLLTGLTAILLAIWSLFAAMDLGRWLDSSFARRLIPLRGRWPLALARLSAAMLPALGSGALALLTADRPGACILALLPYLLFWSAAALGLAQCPALWEPLPVLMPFVPVLGLLLSPVLTDLSELVPALTLAVRWSPVTRFLRACEGRWTDGLLLAAGAMVILALVFLSTHEKRPAAE